MYRRGDYEVTFGAAWFILDHCTHEELGRIISEEIRRNKDELVQRECGEAEHIHGEKAERGGKSA